MKSKALVVLSAVAIMGISSAATAKGAGGGGGGKGGWSHGGMFGRGHGQFDHRQFDRRFRFVNRFNRNPFLLGGWGWGGDWGLGGYGDSGYGNTNVVVYPMAAPQFATGSIAAAPCHWNEDTFKVPSVFGGTQPVSVVSCR
jgi:opacity protein-like surface antigen